MADNTYTPGPDPQPGPLINTGTMPTLGPFINPGFTLPWGPLVNQNFTLPSFLPGGTGPDLGRADPGYTQPASQPSDDIAKAVINAKAIVRPPLPAPGNVTQDTLNAWVRQQINPEKADVTYYTGNDLRDWLHQHMPGLGDFADALQGSGAIHVAAEADPRLWYSDIQGGIEDIAGLLAERKGLLSPIGRQAIEGNAYSWNYPTRPMNNLNASPTYLSTIAVDRNKAGPETTVHEAAHAGAKSANKASDLPFNSNQLWLSNEDRNSLYDMFNIRNLIRAINGYTIPSNQVEVPSTFSEVSYGRDYADPQDPRNRYARILRGMNTKAGVETITGLDTTYNIPPQNQVDLAARVRDNLINKVIEYYTNGLNEAPPPGLPQ